MKMMDALGADSGRQAGGSPRRRRPWLVLVLLPVLSLLACSAAPAPTGTRPPVIETVMARRTETTLATRGAASPLAGYRLLVANSGSAELTVVDPIAGRTLAVIDLVSDALTELPSGWWHFGLAASADGRWVLAPGHYSRSL